MAPAAEWPRGGHRGGGWPLLTKVGATVPLSACRSIPANNPSPFAVRRKEGTMGGFPFMAGSMKNAIIKRP